ncbi:MAG: IS256 family transposase [Gammaproteobacteria bacterium]|nr:IS256 family transposase [Gammaproteobacteria bacterium]
MAINDEMLDELLGNAKTQDDLFGKEGILKQLSKQLMERLLEMEMTNHLGYMKHAVEGNNSGNSRNGKTKKTVKTGNGQIEITVPRDRQSEFEPILVEKRQSHLKGLDDQVLSLYARGMTVRDIQSHLTELYGTEISRDLISTMTDAVLEDVTEWRSRPLDKIYPIVFIDGFVAKCRLDGRVSNRTVYVMYGINMEGQKEVLGLYIGENEGAKFWLQVLTELKNRGVEDVFILCADGLKGLPESVEATFPNAIFQTCVVHMVRHSLNYVPYQEKKVVAADLKKIYQSPTRESACEALDDFELTWGEKYAAIVKSWRQNWERIIPFLDFPMEIRKVIYTTNMVESLNATLRKAVRNRGHFSTEDSLMKVLYLAISGVSKKWTMPIRDWKLALNRFSIMFPERFPEKLLA